MFGKKILWFVGSTFVSFLVFSSIAWTIQPLVTKLTDQRLTACGGQSVITENDQRYSDATTISLATIQAEERLWQAQGITHYCIEVSMSGSRMDEVTFVLVVQNSEIDTRTANCQTEGSTESCRIMIETLEAGTEYPITVVGLFDTLSGYSTSGSHQVSGVFDTAYHFPTFVRIDYLNGFDDEVLWEVISFVPLP